MTSSLLDLLYMLGTILSLVGPAAHARYSVITGFGILYISGVIFSVVGPIVHPKSDDMSIVLCVDDD
jgi:hypothetical protein